MSPPPPPPPTHAHVRRGLGNQPGNSNYHPLHSNHQPPSKNIAAAPLNLLRHQLAIPLHHTHTARTDNTHHAAHRPAGVRACYAIPQHTPRGPAAAHLRWPRGGRWCKAHGQDKGAHRHGGPPQPTRSLTRRGPTPPVPLANASPTCTRAPLPFPVGRGQITLFADVCIVFASTVGGVLAPLQCRICGDDDTELVPPRIPENNENFTQKKCGGDHRYCGDCMVGWITAEVTQRKSSVCCPHPGCHRQLSFADVKVRAYGVVPCRYRMTRMTPSCPHSPVNRPPTQPIPIHPPPPARPQRRIPR